MRRHSPNKRRFVAAASILLAVAAVAVCLCRGIALAAEPAVPNAAAADAAQPASPPAPAATATIVFERQIAPIFAAKCIRCHGPDVQKSELNLSTPAGVLKGGGSGVIVSAGKPDDSLLNDYIENDQMPPEEVKDPKLRTTSEEKKLIHDWIAAGAKFESATAPTAEPSDAVTDDDVLPILLANCSGCHGLRKQEAALDLHTREAILRGGRSGPAIVPGHPEQSLMLKRIHAGEMPPNKRLVQYSVKPLDAHEIEVVTKWIAQGAPASTLKDDIATTEPDTQVSDQDRKFWSFQRPTPKVPPTVVHKDRVRNPIDAFVLAKLEPAGLSLAPEADLRTLVRRAYFDLTGLPPTPAEIEAVVNDHDSTAYEKLVDRLLDSPRYGERWGRYWLDMAGYADSEGTTDQDVIREFGWRYRDYVIRAYNSDKPYDRFLMEQLAGDELADYEHAPEITPEIYDNLVATGFLRMAPDGTTTSTNNFVVDRLAVIADEIQVLSSSVLGLTMQCARCHSHKFDPFPHRDYYRLMAVFKPALDEEDWLTPAPYPTPEPNNVTRTLEECRFLTQVTPDELRPIQEHNAPLKKQIASLEQEKQQAADVVRNKLLRERLADLPKSDRKSLNYALAVSFEKRTPMQKITIDAMAERMNVDEETLRQDADYRELATKLDKQIEDVKKKLKPTPLIRALWDRGTPSPTFILRRGEPTSPTRRVGPGVPSVLTDGKTPFDVKPPWPGAKSTGRRLAFAKWLVNPEQPLTARVLVNRVWLQHFGRGIVITPDNFGKMGSPPSHPELLDWLAIEFMQHGWSQKALHRLMMTSSTYRQSSEVSEEEMQRDPDNLLFSRMPIRRLDAEAVRDSILSVAGKLDETRFGPPDQVDERRDGLVTIRSTEHGWRRSIYAQQRRTQLPSLLESFDLPQMSPNCIVRPTSTVAPQALQLLHDAQIHELAIAMANRITAEAGNEPEKQVDRLFALALNRTPDAKERRLALSSLQKLASEWMSNRPELEVNATASNWIRESEPDKEFDRDLIYVYPRKSGDRGRRSSLVEFDLSKLKNVTIESAELELSPVQSGLRVRQKAALIAPGIEHATWKIYEKDKAPTADPLESLGAFDLTTTAAQVSKYCVSKKATSNDLAKLQKRIDADGRVAFVLSAVEEGARSTAEWDDGEGPATNRKPPRLVLLCKDGEGGKRKAPETVVEQARQSALANLCHAMINSPEFIFVD